MKSITTTVGIALFFGCISSRAAGWTDNLYLNADLGSATISGGTTHHLALVQGEIVHRSGQFQADTGIRGDLSLGYHLTKSLAVELEAGAISNPGPGTEDEFYQIPTMLKMRYQVPLNNSWKIDFGAGAGGVVVIDQSEIRTATVYRSFLLKDTSSSFGYEADAGIKYTPSPHLEIGLGYKFLDVSEFRSDFITYDLNGFPVVVEGKVNDLFTHTALLSFTWKF
ncbi:MAG TPA: outer membrane beta-barrel protein [Verrucomicrobiae bacterium]|jgi:opacity protein-like surface antigen|nr:outer membrane beta-barrel protein [Verrucomicrobiae bacterium]